MVLFFNFMHIIYVNYSIPASSLDELRSKLQCSLIQDSGFTLVPNTVERFIEAFSQEVEKNGLSELTPEYVSYF